MRKSFLLLILLGFGCKSYEPKGNIGFYITENNSEDTNITMNFLVGFLPITQDSNRKLKVAIDDSVYLVQEAKIIPLKISTISFLGQKHKLEVYNLNDQLLAKTKLYFPTPIKLEIEKDSNIYPSVLWQKDKRFRNKVLVSYQPNTTQETVKINDFYRFNVKDKGYFYPPKSMIEKLDSLDVKSCSVFVSKKISRYKRLKKPLKGGFNFSISLEGYNNFIYQPNY